VRRRNRDKLSADFHFPNISKTAYVIERRGRQRAGTAGRLASARAPPPRSTPPPPLSSPPSSRMVNSDGCVAGAARCAAATPPSLGSRASGGGGAWGIGASAEKGAAASEYD